MGTFSWASWGVLLPHFILPRVLGDTCLRTLISQKCLWGLLLCPHGTVVLVCILPASPSPALGLFLVHSQIPGASAKTGRSALFQPALSCSLSNVAYLSLHPTTLPFSLKSSLLNEQPALAQVLSLGELPFTSRSELTQCPVSSERSYKAVFVSSWPVVLGVLRLPVLAPLPNSPLCLCL